MILSNSLMRWGAAEAFDHQNFLALSLPPFEAFPWSSPYSNNSSPDLQGTSILRHAALTNSNHLACSHRLPNLKEPRNCSLRLPWLHSARVLHCTGLAHLRWNFKGCLSKSILKLFRIFAERNNVKVKAHCLFFKWNQHYNIF